VSHFEIQTENADKVQKFYRDLFDWKVQVLPEMGGYGLVDTGGQGGIGGGIGPVPQGGRQMVTFYVDVDNPQAYMDKAVKLGKVLVPPQTIPGMVTFGLFADPDGNVVGVAKNERPAGPGPQQQRR
jgi:predicted enzyme related to lactoylglutathione lyase